MSKSCVVTTGARLHFGPLAWKPDSGRDFGGWGMMIDRPRTIVRVLRAPVKSPFRSSDPAAQLRAEAIVAALRATADFGATPATAEVRSALPAHRGLGSGTQLSLAVAKCVAGLAGRSEMSIVELADRLGRGQRSAVGLYGFESGGLIVDAGKRPQDPVAALAARLEVPDTWRVVLVCPRHPTGLTGESESVAFRSLPPFPPELTDRLCRIVLTEILPAVRNDDFPAFAAALDDYGRRVGSAFQGVQGGTVHPASQELFEAAREQRLHGVAQSSWGPALAIFQPSAEAAADLLKLPALRQYLDAADVTTAAPLNAGAQLAWEDDRLPG